MENLKNALSQLNALNDRLHDLVEPEKAVREACVAVVVASADAIVALGSRITELESQVAAIVEHPALSVPPLQPQVAADQKSPGTDATIEAAPAAGSEDSAAGAPAASAAPDAPADAPAAAAPAGQSEST